MHPRYLIPLLAAALAGGAALADDAPLVTPSIALGDSVVRAGETLELAEVAMDQAGFIVVYADQPVIGPGTPSATQVFVNPGTHSGVLVPIEGGFQAGVPYAVALHYDTNGNGTFDYETDASVDGPVMQADGTPYIVPVMIQPAD